jgi:hypothetical protein
MSKFKFILLISLVLLLFSATLQADTPPVLKISDSSGNIITIDDSGTVVTSGTCTPTTCTTDALLVKPGKITWSGTIGSYAVLGFTVGSSKTATNPSPQMDLSIQQLTSSVSGNTVTFQWTDTNFNTPSLTGATLLANGTMNGGASATFSAFFDTSNIEFGTGMPLGTPYSISGTGTTSINGTISGPAPTTTPFSMTEMAAITLNAGSTFTVDALFQAQPSPLTLLCAAGTGQVGVP